MIKFEFEDRVETYCKNERQWPRHLRIQHAEYMRSLSPKNTEDWKFWDAILKRNRD